MKTKEKCPICHEPAGSPHCTNPKCEWTKCENTECLAILDNGKGIGTHKDPKGTVDLKTKMPRRLRVIRIAGVWTARDAT